MIGVYLYLAHFKVGLLTYLTLEFKLKGREHTREDKRKRERGEVYSGDSEDAEMPPRLQAPMLPLLVTQFPISLMLFTRRLFCSYNSWELSSPLPSSRPTPAPTGGALTL